MYLPIVPSDLESPEHIIQRFSVEILRNHKRIVCVRFVNVIFSSIAFRNITVCSPDRNVWIKFSNFREYPVFDKIHRCCVTQRNSVLLIYGSEFFQNQTIVVIIIMTFLAQTDKIIRSVWTVIFSMLDMMNLNVFF